MLMAKCTNCSFELNPSWKFCISCGQAVQPVMPEPTEVLPVTPESDAPQPDAGAQPTARRLPDLAISLSILVAVGGGLLIILVALELFSSRG